MVKAYSYKLLSDNGAWLGQVVLTDDGMFSGVTDWGNFSYAWRAFGGSFKEFILGITPDYFGAKMAQGLSYTVRPTKKTDSACYKFAEMILPALQKAIKEEA